MKTLKLFSMAALALVMAACSSEDNEIQQPAEQGKMHFTATIAAPNSGATIRTTVTPDGDKYNVAWAVDDEIALVYEDGDGNRQKDKAVVTAVDPVTGAATISATLNHTVDDQEPVTLVYPYSIVSSPEVDGQYNKEYSPDVSFFINQDFATLADGISGYDWRDGNGVFSVNGSNVTLKGNVKLESNVAIWKLTLQDDATNLLSADVLEIYATLPIPVCGVKYNSPTSSVNIIVPIPILDGNPQLFGPYIEFIASVSGNDYSYTHTSGVALTGSKIYESTLTLKQLSYDLIGGEGIYYFAGESFAQAIPNHFSKNSYYYWMIDDGKVVNLNTNKYLKNAAGTSYIGANDVIDPSATYTWGD